MCEKGGVRRRCSDWYQIIGWGYLVFIIELIVGGGFFVDVKSFNGVQVWAFLMELYNLHDVFYGAKGV